MRAPARATHLPPTAMHRDELTRYLDQTLDAARVADYCPNGLQVEGRPEIATLVTGVTASLALIEAAIAVQADALLVHHGYFWLASTRSCPPATRTWRSSSTAA